MHRTVKMVLMIFSLGCVLMSGCTADKTPETVPATLVSEENTTAAAETTLPAETADPELEAGFVEIDPEEVTSAPAKPTDDNKNNADQKEETVPPVMEPSREDPNAVYIPNMGDLVP